ncbi:hypothetical protein O3I_035565 [Nocardia brasiliensis ATCC 700358]|uniref:Uncharacterized protein n=1 Tax=Nocardia brasiliensis (strain ATCC 700358 / HUJEG-1) TaxID=1133849 RepID=K0F6R5_NOCB7|nr:hypothetical protein O3I_035565 [Nocardia brasiliensis ATCC 700358]
MVRVVDYRERLFTNFREFEFGAGGSHCFQWIDSKEFALAAAEADDREVLSDLIASVEYRDDYVGGGIDPSGIRHGPYWLDRISSEAYAAIDESAVIELLERWLHGCGSIPDQLREEIQREVVGPVRTATSRYVLEDLGVSAINDYGDLHREFHEIVLIDRRGRRVLLVVMTDD